MKRKVLSFSLRQDASGDIRDLIPRIDQALGCDLQVELTEDGPQYVGAALGLRIVCLRWPGIGGRFCTQLHGWFDTTGHDELEWEVTRVDEPLADMLELRGAGAWRVPSREELDAESDYDSGWEDEEDWEEG